jgi:branched-chain amino acid transport system ATP-binding protein
MPAHARVDAGLSRCFQVTSVYPALTVAENLMLAAQSQTRSRMRPWGTRAARAGLIDRARALAHRVGLGTLLDQVAGTLAHGAQRQLDVALALAAQPKLLLLDEPMAGMGPDESARMACLIESLRGESAILLIEHDMSAVFKLADQISVLVYGRVIATGSVEEIRASQQVQDVYLGKETHA